MTSVVDFRLFTRASRLDDPNATIKLHLNSMDNKLKKIVPDEAVSPARKGIG